MRTKNMDTHGVATLIKERLASEAQERERLLNTLKPFSEFIYKFCALDSTAEILQYLDKKDFYILPIPLQFESDKEVNIFMHTSPASLQVQIGKEGFNYFNVPGFIEFANRPIDTMQRFVTLSDHLSERSIGFKNDLPFQVQMLLNVINESLKSTGVESALKVEEVIQECGIEI